ncbi:MAG: TRAP transporter small permease [Clostridiales Family XIII bacterium]|nr:TRAP transporter small permease [Clostridiales Family XIII bacterium]
MRRLTRIYDKLEEYLLVVSLAFTVCVIFYQIIMRFVFNNSQTWTEELARYIFIWQIWLGASIGIRESKHIRVEMFSSALARTAKAGAGQIAELVILILWLSVTAAFTWHGFVLTAKQAELGALSPGLRIPLAYCYAAVPVGCAVMSLRLLGLMRKEILELASLRKGGL